MDKILNVLLAGGIAYILIFGFKDREPPVVKIKFPKNNYTFRSNKPINIFAEDNKGIKSITYYIDDEIYFVDTNNSFKDLWNPCDLYPGKHILKVEASDHRKNVSSTDNIVFSISTDLKVDCYGTCDGDAVIDDCGICSGGNSNHKFNEDIDCHGNCFDGMIVDNCGICGGQNASLDCNDECDGEAFIDECGICSGGNSIHEPNSDIDCNGDCFGKAKTDKCGTCYGGLTNLSKNSNLDCSGQCNGDAFLDECGTCSAGNSNHIPNSDKDCYGDCFGNASIDKCGFCSGGNTGKNEDKDVDCNGVCSGKAYLDDCNACSGGNTKHIPNSDKDCFGTCFGSASIDDCLICSGGETENIPNSELDCNSDCTSLSLLWDGYSGGLAYLDDCGICSEGNSNHEPNSDIDCNGDCFGIATVDPCGGCSGGKTGIETFQSKVIHNEKSYTCGDVLFIMEMYKLKYPYNSCSSFDILNNEKKLNECLSEYFSLGELGWKNGRLYKYILSSYEIEGIFPDRAKFATRLRYLDISNNKFWGPFPDSFCDIDLVRIAGNRFCPPYPDCFNKDPIRQYDLEMMGENARCK